MSLSDFKVSDEFSKRLAELLEEYTRPFDTSYFSGLKDAVNLLKLTISTLETHGAYQRLNRSKLSRQDFNRLLGRNLTRERRNRNMTQQTLADLTGITTSMCSHIETGKRGPTCYQLTRIAKALRISPRSMLPE
jgi:DNA-binding XRE family transcriptional regulator